MDSQDSDFFDKKKPTSRRTKWLFLSLSFILFLILCGYGLLTYAAQSSTLPFVKYQDKNVGFTSFSQVTKEVLKSDKRIRQTEVVIALDSKEENRKLEQLNISIQSSKTADAIYNFGKTNFYIKFPNLNYFRKLISGQSNIPVTIKYSSDTEKKIEEIFPDCKKEAINPELKLENNTLSVSAESDGTKVDVNDFVHKIENKLNGNLPGAIQLTKIATKSEFTTTDVEMFKNEIEEFIGKQIYLQSDYKKILIKKDELVKFIDLERTILNQKFTLSDDAISEYLSTTAAKNFNVKGKKKQISTLDQQVISEGREGKQVDIAKSLINIKEAFEKNNKIARLEVATAPIEEEYISPGYNPGKYPGRYIEVNLTQQMLYTFDGNQLINSYKVSTGKWSMPTPQGEYTINNKNERAYSSRYGLYMPYWMAFIGSEYGIHELPEWPNGTKEGESHLGTPVSHGCVRLGRGSAQSVYDFAEIGTPVFIHK